MDRQDAIIANLQGEQLKENEARMEIRRIMSLKLKWVEIGIRS